MKSSGSFTASLYMSGNPSYVSSLAQLCPDFLTWWVTCHVGNLCNGAVIYNTEDTMYLRLFERICFVIDVYVSQ